MTINILGTPYSVGMKRYEEVEDFERLSISGYCDGYSKEIVVCDMHTFKGWEKEKENSIAEAQKQTLRHEIVHAFLTESGLTDNAHICEVSWAKNEELVDWIANQGLKIHKAWVEAGAV